MDPFQQEMPQQDPSFESEACQVLIQHRNEMMDRLATAETRIRFYQRKVDDLDAQLAAANKKVAELSPKEADTPPAP